MPTCLKCGKKGLFLKRNAFGLCRTCELEEFYQKSNYVMPNSNDSITTKATKKMKNMIGKSLNSIADKITSDEKIDYSAVEVAGTYHTDAKRILSGIVRDSGDMWNTNGYSYHKMQLTLIPEPQNPHDSNAILVMSEHETPPRARVSRSGKIGYLPAEVAKTVHLNNPVVVDVVVKEGFGNFYVKIDLSQLI